MQQTIEAIKSRLAHKNAQLACQHQRQEILECTISNTEDDIEQLEYTLHELEAIQNGCHRQRVIPRCKVSEFFMHISELFEYLQHHLRRRLNYQMTCIVIYARYPIQTRFRSPSRQYLSPATVLSYFKAERGSA